MNPHRHPRCPLPAAREGAPQPCACINCRSCSSAIGPRRASRRPSG